MTTAGQKNLVYYAKCGHAAGILIEIYIFIKSLVKPAIRIKSGQKDTYVHRKARTRFALLPL